MKVGIYTLNGLYNFGNRLQNYALVSYLNNNLNVTAFNIWVGKRHSVIKYLLKKAIPLKKYNRYVNFYDFNKLIKTDYKNIDSYDCYIVGSDQVWNPQCMENLYDIFLLNSNKYLRKVSYAASFGVESLPSEYIQLFKKCIDSFDYVSVREDKGKEIINDMLKNKEVEVLIDPTMLLSKNEWAAVSKMPKAFNCIKGKKYILNYFLGELSEERINEIERVAKENDCIIINMLDSNSPFYECGPSEFIYLEMNAFLICTDSFHSSVFAFLFDKPFIVFDREEIGKNNMGSRIDTLLKKFNMKDRRYNGKTITTNNLKHNYEESFTILEEERNRAKDFLSKALK